MYNNPNQFPYGYQNYPQNNMSGMLQPQQIIKVNGRESINTLKLTPNSSLLALDNNAPIVWLCVADGVGNVNATAYDITPHVDEETKHVSNLEERISKIEQKLESMGERNEKSNYSNAKSK